MSLKRPLSPRLADETRRGQWTTDAFDSLHQKKSRDAYLRGGADLVTFLVGACLDKLEKVRMDVPEEQQNLAWELHEALQAGDGSAVPVLQRFLFSIFSQSMENSTAHVFPAYRFLVLYSFRHDGSIEPCNNITQIISKIVFYARACIYMHIRATMDANHCGFFS